MFVQKLAISILLFGSCQVSAHTPQRGKVWGTIGPLIYQTIANGEQHGATTPWLGGAGLLAEGDVDHNGGLEIGMFYQHKMFYAQKDVRSLVEKVKLMTISMGYRHWFNRQFSFGGAFYSSYIIGEPVVVHKNYTNTASDFSTSARDVTEYGFDFSFQWEVWGNEKQAIVLDARYSQSVTAKAHESGNIYGLLVGFKHSIDVN